MKNEGMKRRVIRYQHKIEHIRKLIDELKQYVDTVELKPVSEEAIIELERHLKRNYRMNMLLFCTTSVLVVWIIHFITHHRCGKNIEAIAF